MTEKHRGAALVGKQEFAKAATELFDGKIIQVRPGANKCKFVIEYRVFNIIYLSTPVDLSPIPLSRTSFSKWYHCCRNNTDILNIEMQGCKYEVSMITLYDTGFTAEEKEELKSHIDGYMLMYDVTNKFSVERVKNYMKLILQLIDPLSPILQEMNRNSWQNIHKKKRESQKKALLEQQQNGSSPPSASTDPSGLTNAMGNMTLSPSITQSNPFHNNQNIPSDSLSPSIPSNSPTSPTSLTVSIHSTKEKQSTTSSNTASVSTPLSPTTTTTTISQSNLLPVILIGNKCDVSDEEREVDIKEGLQMGDKYACPFVETSAIFKKKGIESAFIELIKRIDKTRDEKRKTLTRTVSGSADSTAIDRRKSISSIFSFASVSKSDSAVDDYQQNKKMREMRRQQLSSKQQTQ